MLRDLTLLMFVLIVPLAAHAEEPEPVPDPYLTAAVAALGEQDFELGLELLDRASRQSDDPRITYYRAFALEKVGRCREARTTYETAVSDGPPRFTRAARSALDGFDTRCVAAAPASSQPTTDLRPPRRSNTLATVGWVLTTVGGLVLVSLPVKIAFDREVATQSEQYFEQVYECDVDFGKLAPDCDADEVKSNPQWDTYERRIRTAKRSNVWMIAGGSMLLVAGITSVIIGSSRPALAIGPIGDGPGLVWSVSF